MTVNVEGRELVIRIPLDERDGTTGNGNVLVASTHGWRRVETGVSLSLNVVRKV